MDIVELSPRLHFLRFPVGHVYLWQDPDGLTPPVPVRVDRELTDGEVLDFGGGAQAIAAPGHTPGSAAFNLPDARALFTGDTIARLPDGRVILGAFNVNPDQAVASFRRQAALSVELGVEVACFGHGEPLLRAAAEWRHSAKSQGKG